MRECLNNKVWLLKIGWMPTPHKAAWLLLMGSATLLANTCHLLVIMENPSICGMMHHGRCSVKTSDLSQVGCTYDGS